MALYRSLFLIIFILLFSLLSYAQEIPSSLRSQAAISRVRPDLEREMESNGFGWGSAVFMRIFKASEYSMQILHRILGGQKISA